jgi:DNA-binding Xre family transcriptional regulator
MEFFGLARSQNKILSASIEAIKVTVFPKICHRLSCLPDGSKIKFVVWYYLTKNWH